MPGLGKCRWYSGVFWDSLDMFGLGGLITQHPRVPQESLAHLRTCNAHMYIKTYKNYIKYLFFVYICFIFWNFGSCHPDMWFWILWRPSEPTRSHNKLCKPDMQHHQTPPALGTPRYIWILWKLPDKAARHPQVIVPTWQQQPPDLL